MAKSSNASLSALEQTLDLYFGKKAPALPSGAKEFLVSIAPWAVLVCVLVTLPAVLALAGISSFVMPMYSYMAYPGTGPWLMLSSIVLVITIILEALAIPGLFSRSKQGWNYVFYASLVSVVFNLISFNFIGAIISGLISFYLLFQLKSYYR